MNCPRLLRVSLAIVAATAQIHAQELGGSTAGAANASRPRRVGAARDISTLLGFAALNRIDGLEPLLDHGVAVDAHDYNGNTALIVASANASDDAIALLLSRGAHINDVNARHQTALMMAAWSGYAIAVGN